MADMTPTPQGDRQMTNPKSVDEKIAAAVRDGATELDLDNTNVTDISALANCTALEVYR